jgi:hypothetical protein
MKPRTRKIIAAACSVLVVKLVLALLILHVGGFYPFLTGDEPSKALCGWGAKKDILSVYGNSMWLPLQYQLWGVAFHLFPDTLALPIAWNLVATGICAGLIFFLTYSLCAGSIAASLIAALLYATHPFFSWYSVSGLEMPTFHLLMVLSVAGCVRYAGGKGRGWLFAAATGLLLGSAIRYEGWIFIAAFGLYLLRVLFIRRERLSVASWALLLAVSFIIPWLWWQQVHFGDWLFFVKRQHDTGINEAPMLGLHALSKAGLWRKYLADAFSAFSLPGLVLLTAGFAAARSGLRGLAGFFPAFFFFSLGLISMYSISGSWMQKQFSTVVLLALPFFAQGISAIARVRPRLPMGVLSASFVILLVLGWAREAMYTWVPDYRYTSAKRIGLRLRTLPVDAGHRVLVQLREKCYDKECYYWDSIFIHLIHPDHTLLDREDRTLIKDGEVWLDTQANPSILSMPSERLMGYLSENKITYVAASGLEAKIKCGARMAVVACDGEYCLFSR